MIYGSFMLMILYIFGHYDKAIEVSNEIVPQMSSLWSWRCTRVVYFYASLAIIARLREDPSLRDQQDDLLLIVDKYNAQIKEWQSHCDVNYLMWSLLIEAEVCEVRDQLHESTQAYEAAIDQAQLNDFNLELAIILESQSCFFVRRGARRAAVAMMKDAMAVYSRIGAAGKVEQLATRNEYLLSSFITVRTIDVAVQTETSVAVGTQLQLEGNERQETEAIGEEVAHDRTKAWISPGPERPGTTRRISQPDLGLDILDLTSILQFNQAISSELDVDKLLVKMTEIIITSAGSQADLVRIVTKDEERGWCIAASGNLDGHSATVGECALDRVHQLNLNL